MGNGESSRIFQDTTRVNCAPRIQENDFQAKVNNTLSDEDKRVLRGGMTLLGDYPSWVWRDAAVRCIGENIDYTFYCPSCTNQFVVCLNERNDVKKQCSRAGWLMFFYETAVFVWTTVKAVAPLALAAGGVAGKAMKAIKF